MTTWRQIVYMVLDELLITSDDASFNEGHIIFLASKMRGLLLKLQYKDIKKQIPESNFLTLCIDLIQVSTIVGEYCEEGVYLRSKNKIPFLMNISTPMIHTEDYYQGEITYIPKERMRYIGHNRWLSNIIYSSISPDNYLYLKSYNPLYLYLDKVSITGIFESPEKVVELIHSDTTTDILDREFPIEEPLIPQLIELVVKELSRPEYLPQDKVNNSSDDLSGAASSNGRDK